jgi:hypothetical protein
MQKITLHTFTIGDVEDPYLYAAQPIYEWQQTEHGRWCMEHAIGEPVFWCQPDPNTFGFRIVIECELEEKDCTYLRLKWDK